MLCVNCQNISRYIFETSVRHLKKVWVWKALGELSVVFLGVRTQKWNDFFCSPYDIFINFLKTEIELSCVVCVCLCVLCVCFVVCSGRSD